MLDDMIVNWQTMMMALRKGDCGASCLRLTEDAIGGTFWFVVKESLEQADEDAPILQKYEHAGGPYLLIEISEEESDRLSAEGSSTCSIKPKYKDYIWAIKYVQNIRDEEGNIIGTGKVKTFIPCHFNNPPIFRVYPEVIRGPHYDA